MFPTLYIEPERMPEEPPETFMSQVPRKCLTIDGMVVLHLITDQDKGDTIAYLSRAFNS